VNKLLRRIINRLGLLKKRDLDTSDQIILKMMYRNMRGLSPEKLPRFSDVGFRCFSQFEEDGILLFIFSLIGEKTKKVVEMCVGDGTECMATNLIINHGWEGILFDGNKRLIKRGRKFFADEKLTTLYPPVLKHAWITAENVDDLLCNALDVQKTDEVEIDLFSLDIDGVDYWVLKNINVINPRVCIIETNNCIPSDLSLTVKYNPVFLCDYRNTTRRDYVSMSLRAAVKLFRDKGYRLIGSHRYGFNAIFMRNDVGTEYFPEVSIESVHAHPYTKHAQAVRWPVVKSYEWEEV